MTFGPKPAGTWTGHKAANCGDKHNFLRAGERYEVIQAFADYDQHLHAVGESWVLLGYSFLPYDDGMSFFVSFDGEQEWHIRLQWRPEEQGQLLDNLAQYIRAL
jgi:hypothetical protein